MTIIGVCNRKGGVAKTQSVASIAACLALKGKKVLLIDADTQCNLGIYILGDDVSIYDDLAYKGEEILTVYDVLCKKASAADAVMSRHYTIKRLYNNKYFYINCDIDLLPSSKQLDELALDESGMREVVDIIRKAGERYDFVLVDFPPSLSDSTIAFLAACDKVIVPAGAGLDTDIVGFIDVLDAIEIVQNSGLNDDIEPLGMFYTRVMEYKSDQMSAYQDRILEKDDWMLFESYIREDYKHVREAFKAHQPLPVCFPRSKAAKDYAKLTDEILKVLEG